MRKDIRPKDNITDMEEMEHGAWKERVTYIRFNTPPYDEPRSNTKNSLQDIHDFTAQGEKPTWPKRLRKEVSIIVYSGNKGND